jgi:elongation factor Ts
MAISASMVKELREKTGAGMMDCKKALMETNGDLEAAVDWLRTKGIAKAEKKASRVAAEGLIAAANNANKAALIELNSETDFVSRNEGFQTLARTAAEVALNSNGDVTAIAAMPYPGSDRSVAEEVKEAVATIGENMNMRRAAVVEVSNGVVASYMHSAVGDNLGKIGVLVGVESTGDAAALSAIGKQVAMHIAATSPLALTSDDLDADVVARERAVYEEAALESGKPEAIVEKIVDGQIRKFFQESALLSQAFVINPDLTVEQAVKEAEDAAGAPITITSYVRLALGEGVEKDEVDFAAEVAAVAGGS